MIFCKIEQIDGDYIDANGTRWIVNCCRRIRTCDGVNVGWEEFPSMESALKAWVLQAKPLS